MRLTTSLFFAAALLGLTLSRAADAPDFNRDIRPILSDNCIRCHGPDENERKGGQNGLRLDTLAGATEDLGGGGYAIVPGDVAKSELLMRVKSDDEEEIMPPPETGKTLAARQIELHVAPRGRATQSSTFEGISAALAIDGRTDGDVARGSVAQTKPSDGPWLEIDLQSTQPLERVVVWGRTGLEPTPGGLRVIVLDEQRQGVWEQVAKDAPKPSRVFDLGDPVELKLGRVATDYAHADFDETLVGTDQQPKAGTSRKRGAKKRGWSVAGAADQPTLSIEPVKPITLIAGESLVVTIEQQAVAPRATLNHFRVSVTTDPRAKEHLLEQGVRFMQLFDWGWDFHGTKPSQGIRDGLTQKMAETDKPVTALIRDLKQRGLLDDTLVIWGGEFGRTPFREGRTSEGQRAWAGSLPGCVFASAHRGRREARHQLRRNRRAWLQGGGKQGARARPASDDPASAGLRSHGANVPLPRPRFPADGCAWQGGEGHSRSAPIWTGR